MEAFRGLRCVLCGQEDCVSVDLDDLETFRCRQCEEEFTRADVVQQVAAWGRVLAWVDQSAGVEVSN